MWWWLVLVVPLAFFALLGWSRLWEARQRQLARDHRLGPRSARPEEVGRTLRRVWTAAQGWSGQEEAEAAARYFAPILDTYREPLTIELRRMAGAGDEVARLTAEKLGLPLGEG